MSEENKNQGQQSSQATKQASKKVANMAAKKIIGKGSMMGPLSHVLIAIAPILILVIFLIGIILFLLTMPGMVMEKLKALFNDVANAIAAYFGADTTQMVDDEDIYATLDYLEEMGYDLKGFGFLTDYIGDSDDGVERDENDKISDAESDFIFTYMVSDNYIYTLKNDNLATQNNESGFLNFLAGLGTGTLKFFNQALSPVFDLIGVTDGMMDSYGKGMIGIYYEEDGVIGKRGTAVNSSFLNWDSVQIDAGSKSLLIQRNEFLNNSNAMKFSLDGWTGRYGMPLEFLLSVHMATMMPDLAFDMATSFATNINIYLHETGDQGQAITAYKTDTSYITYEQLENALSGESGRNWFSSTIAWFDNNSISDSEAKAAFDIGMTRAPNCEGKEVCGSESKPMFNNTPLQLDTETGEYFYTIPAHYHIPETRHPVSADEITWVPGYCNNCKQFLKKVIKKLRKDNDYNFKAYIPYIADVTNHWYRDIYFTQVENKNFVQYDYDYEAITGERWTLYETYDSGDKKGQFKLYKVENGNLGDLYSGTIEEARKNNISVAKKAKTISATEETYTDYGWSKNSEGTWTAYTVNENTGSTGYQRIYEDDSEEIQEATDEVEKSVMKNVYVNIITSGNPVQTGEGLRTETNSEIKKMFLNNYYFKYDGTAERAEIITAIRNKIANKKVTTTTTQTTTYAGATIENTVEHVSYDIKQPYGNLKDLGGSGTDYTKKSYKLKIGDQEEKEYKVSDYSGKVSLNQDSLNAFSMLENTHTLDADFIYRDFKELIVELGYFDKEDLTESTPKLLQWIVPDIGSAGFPYRFLDKNENEFGTMLHSKGDIDANEKTKILNRLEGFLQEEKESKEKNEKIKENKKKNPKGNTIPGSKENLQTIGGISNINIRTATHITDSIGALDGEKNPSQVSVTEFLKAAKEIHSKMEGDFWEYCAAGRHSGGAGRHTSDGSCPGNYATFESANNGGKTADCSSYVSWVLQEVGIIKDKYTSGDMYTALAEYILTKEEAGELKAGDIVLTENHVQINGENNLQYNAGSTDAIQNPPKSYVPDYTHVIRLPFSGSTNQESEANYEGYKGNEAVVSPVTGILLDYGRYDGNKDKSSITNEKYRQNIDLKYQKNVESDEDDSDEPVLSPEYDPDKPDLVGYAKILVLDAENYKKLESLTENPWKNDSLLTTEKKLDEDGNEKVIAHFSDSEGEWILDEEKRLTDKNLDSNTNDPWTEIAKTVYGYKEFAKSYEATGIAGYVVYIDGFKRELPDEEFEEENLGKEKPQGEEIKKSDYKKIKSNDLQITEPLDDDNKIDSLYKKDEVHNMPSKKATEKLKATASVKEQANSTICVKDGGKDLVFIKEGTVLGRTLTDYELIVDMRNEKYEDYRKESSINGDADGDDDIDEDEDLDIDINKLKEEKDKIIGNYLRIIFRDTDDTVVENVEDYMKLDAVGTKTGIFGDLENIDENSTHAEKIRAAVTYFNSMGFTPEAACGILGNIIQESTLDPKATSSYHGLIQWDSTNRWPKVKEWMASQGYNEDSFAGQIRAIYEFEVTQMPEDRWEELRNLTDVEKAAELFAVYFERCTGGGDTPVWYRTGELYQELVERKKWAQNAYDIYMGDDSKGVKDQ